MKFTKIVFSLCCVASLASAQAFFECQTVGALSATPDCEGLTGTSASVSATGTCALPTEGLQFASILAATQLSSVGGFTIVRPLIAGSGEIVVPLPTGTTNVALDYSWFNSEGSTTQWVDGFDISVCNSLGARLQLLANGDTTTIPASGCSAVVNLSVATTPTPVGAYLSLVSYNGGDNNFGSTLHVDNVNLTYPIPFTMAFSSPLGPGSIQMDLGDGAPGGVYFAAVTLVQGSFPNGPFYGVDISLFDIYVLLQAGAPFFGVLDGSGAYQFGPFQFGLTGLTLYGVALDNILVSNPKVSAPVAYTIP